MWTIPGYEGSLLSRDFEGSSTPFDSSDDSMEWKRSLANPRKPAYNNANNSSYRNTS